MPSQREPVPGAAQPILNVRKSLDTTFLLEKGYLHAKTISVDSEICSIGSTNMTSAVSASTTRSTRLLYNKQQAIELEEDFERDLAHCTEFDLAEYLARNPLVRFRDSIA
jgi:cardiolipin synthase